jgi:hypothetical protein
LNVNPANSTETSSIDTPYSSWQSTSSIRNESLRLLGLYLDGKLDRLENSACMHAYDQTFQTERGSVLLITDNTTQVPAVQDWIESAPGETDPISWMCTDPYFTSGPPCTFRLGQARKNPASWTPLGTEIKYCLSERAPERCTVQSSLPIVAVILFLNLAKAIMMFIIAFSVKESPLLTMGDAIASFLDRPDPYTKDMCLASRFDIQKSGSHWRRGAKLYDPKVRRLFRSASTARWGVCMALYVFLHSFDASSPEF